MDFRVRFTSFPRNFGNYSSSQPDYIRNWSFRPQSPRKGSVFTCATVEHNVQQRLAATPARLGPQPVSKFHLWPTSAASQAQAQARSRSPADQDRYAHARRELANRFCSIAWSSASEVPANFPSRGGIRSSARPSGSPSASGFASTHLTALQSASWSLCHGIAQSLRDCWVANSSGQQYCKKPCPSTIFANASILSLIFRPSLIRVRKWLPSEASRLFSCFLLCEHMHITSMPQAPQPIPWCCKSS